MRWLIAGAGGMVGQDLTSELNAAADEVLAMGRRELDITDGAAVADVVRRARPDVIVNCAAYTRVDDAESHEELATAINGEGVRLLARTADAAGALLVHLSTDFVFDGRKREPYEENDAVGPLSAYGRSKLLGERHALTARRHLLIRTAWLFGTHGPNFVEAIRNQIARGNRALRVVDDQQGRPTYTPHLARAIVRVARLAHADPENGGIIHYADLPACSWFDFAAAIVEEAGAPGVTVTPVSTAAFPRPAKRPAYSVLSTDRYERITGTRPEEWRTGLRDYLAKRP
jgi:dTDP-4-dehydrorhamnose reductase